MAVAHHLERSYVGPAFEQAKVRDAMRVGVITCRPETKLSEVARMMVGYDVHSVVVEDADPNRGLLGIVTSLDLARAAGELDCLTAGEVATTNLITVRSNDPLQRAAEAMAEHGIAHLIVLQPDSDDPVGVVSARGIAAAVAYGGSWRFSSGP
jgi:CBS domain-containing protein